MSHLRCPYCDGRLTVEMETVGRPYLTYERAESIQCDDYKCGAAWETDGDLRDGPREDRL